MQLHTMVKLCMRRDLLALQLPDAPLLQLTMLQLVDDLPLPNALLQQLNDGVVHDDPSMRSLPFTYGFECWCYLLLSIICM